MHRKHSPGRGKKGRAVREKGRDRCDLCSFWSSVGQASIKHLVDTVSKSFSAFESSKIWINLPSLRILTWNTEVEIFLRSFIFPIFSEKIYLHGLEKMALQILGNQNLNITLVLQSPEFQNTVTKYLGKYIFINILEPAHIQAR